MNIQTIVGTYASQELIYRFLDTIGSLFAIFIILYDHRPYNNDNDIEANMYFVLYGNETTSFYSLPFAKADQLSNLAFFNKSRPTVIYTSGTHDGLTDPFVLSIVNSYADQHKYNVIQLNYTKYNVDATTAYTHVLGVGRRYGAALNRAIKGGLNVKSLTLVGHSLGNEVNGGAIKHVKGIPYLIGLDPGGGVYNDLNLFTRGYAGLTITVHSDALEYGSYKMLGDVNYLPNDGHRYQPGCPTNEPLFSQADICDHLKSGYIWASVQYYPTIFPAVSCKYTPLLTRVHCNESWHVLMGVENRIPGNYYFKTGPNWPLGLGMAGIKDPNNGTLSADDPDFEAYA